MSPRRSRMAVAVLALAGVFLSTYLLLYRLGFYGGLVCGSGGGCEVVQASRYASFLGVPVAGWGVGWYAAVLAVALLGLRPSALRPARRSGVSGVSGGREGDRGPTGPARLLRWLAAGGLLFTLYLTAVELFVLEAICTLCVVSALLVVAICGLVVVERIGRANRADRS